MLAVLLGFFFALLAIKRVNTILNKIYKEFEEAPDNTKVEIASMNLEQQSFIDALYFQKDGFRTPVFLLISSASFFVASRIHNKDWLWIGLLIFLIGIVFTTVTYLLIFPN